MTQWDTCKIIIDASKFNQHKIVYQMVISDTIYFFLYYARPTLKITS